MQLPFSKEKLYNKMEKALDKVINHMSNLPRCSFLVDKVRGLDQMYGKVHPTLRLRIPRTQIGMNIVASVMEGKENYYSHGEGGMVVPGVTSFRVVLKV